MASFTVLHSKAESFYEQYHRKPEAQHQTHYCPGCGHGVVHKLVAGTLDELKIADRTIFISPVGCSVFAFYYFDVGNIQAAHGRAPAVATAVKRSRPESIVIAYQGDGDLAAIGAAEIIHAANRGENITVIFINNAIYGMTGGQMAPTTLLGQKSSTTPLGRNPDSEGYPIRVCELLSSLDAPVYVERVALGDNREIMHAARAVRRAIDNQVQGRGFSLVEVLSPCPTIWKMDPVQAQSWVRDDMTRAFPLGVFRDKTKDAKPRPVGAPPPALAGIPKILGIGNGAEPTANSTKAARRADLLDLRLRIAGFGGQGVLLLGELLAEAGMEAGLQVSWLPSYGPEMRSGTSNCHVRLSTRPIASPFGNSCNVLLALNEPSLRKFLPSVEPGGLVIYNGSLPEDCQVKGARVMARPFSQVANQLGESRAANLVMLGALLGITAAVSPEQAMSALKRLVKSERWLEIDRQALGKGREAAASWNVTVQ